MPPEDLRTVTSTAGRARLRVRGDGTQELDRDLAEPAHSDHDGGGSRVLLLGGASDHGVAGERYEVAHKVARVECFDKSGFSLTPVNFEAYIRCDRCYVRVGVRIASARRRASQEVACPIPPSPSSARVSVA